MRILDKKDLLVEPARAIRAIGNLCRTLDHSRKNTALLELVRSSPDKVIVSSNTSAPFNTYRTS